MKHLLPFASTLTRPLLVTGAILLAGCRPSPNSEVKDAQAASDADEGTSAAAPTDPAAKKGESSSERVSPGSSPVSAASLDDRAVLMQIWGDFAKDWNSNDPARLTRWNPSEGVLLLDNPGAFVRVRLRAGVPELRTLPGEYDGARIKSATLIEAVDEGPLPKIKCDDSEEFSEGVFLGATDASFLTTYVKAVADYELAPKEEAAQLAKVERGYAPFKKFMVHDTRADVSFIFALIEGAVVLLAVNAVIPCSA